MAAFRSHHVAVGQLQRDAHAIPQIGQPQRRREPVAAHQPAHEHPDDDVPVLEADAVARSRTERNEGVRMAFGEPLGQKMVGIEARGVRAPNGAMAMQRVDAHHQFGAARDCLAVWSLDGWWGLVPARN